MTVAIFTECRHTIWNQSQSKNKPKPYGKIDTSR